MAMRVHFQQIYDHDRNRVRETCRLNNTAAVDGACNLMVEVLVIANVNFRRQLSNLKGSYLIGR
jgi:hypothetical protein